ncbi:MAG TPA: hypothetical protein VMY18_03435 [Acidobacteriota bacterium]|nr:hypothetical protein [Acidobacteriota bacterium]
MADSCNNLRTNLASQTLVFDEMFLKDWKPLDSPYMGRHQTEVWKQGTGDTHHQDKIEIGQPDLTHRWQRIDAGECEDACSPPRVNVSFGTTRDSYYMEQFRLQSQLFCLTQLRYNTRPGEQIAKIYSGLKKIPQTYTSEFLRVHAFDKSSAVKICSADLMDPDDDFVPDIQPDDGSAPNISGQLTTIVLDSLPTSELTFSYLDYITTGLGLDGYAEGSGVPDGMVNLITDPRCWFKLTNGNPSMKEMMALGDPQSASPLYKIGQGVQKPFGNLVPTLDKQPIRFQVLSGTTLNRVYPYYNVAADTGVRRVKNPAWINARYQLSFIWHPKAIRLFTPDFKKMHEMVPSVNSALFGSWKFINPQGVIQYEMPDALNGAGTACTKNNDEQMWFYWLSALELGFKYEYSEWIVPILHLVDGSGKDSTVDSPVCGSAPEYVEQVYGNDPVVCED